jgi:hypothetical protein
METNILDLRTLEQTTIGKLSKDADLDGRELILVTDSQDTNHIREYFNSLEGSEFDSYFVRVADGDYAEVWGFFGIVPDNNKTVYRIK